jgi:hypothetical protein
VQPIVCSGGIGGNHSSVPACLCNFYVAGLPFLSHSYGRPCILSFFGLTETRGPMITGSHDWRDRKLQDWLLLLLRFAVTQDPADQLAVLALADEIDAVGLKWRPGDRLSSPGRAMRSVKRSSQPAIGTMMLFFKNTPRGSMTRACGAHSEPPWVFNQHQNSGGSRDIDLFRGLPTNRT